MTKHLLLILLPILLIVVAGCKKQTSSTSGEIHQQLPVIDLIGNLDNTVQSLPLSDAVEMVDIVRLETTDKSLIRNIETIEVTKDDIFVLDVNEGIFRFNRKGKFLNKVGEKGQGPEEVLTYWQIKVNESDNTVYSYSITDKYSHKAYNFDGSFKRIASNKNMYDVFMGPKNDFFIFKDHFFLLQGLPLLFVEKNPELWSFALTDSCFNIKKKFYNPDLAGKDSLIIQNHAPHWGWVNYWEEGLANVETYNQELITKYFGADTLYQFNEQTLEFDPIYKLELGERPPFEMEHQWIKDPSFFGYLRNQSVFNTKDYFYFHCGKSEQSYVCRYDKTNGDITSLKKDCAITEKPLTGSPNFIIRYQQLKLALQNDISGGCDFTVDYKSQGKYWIDKWKPDELLENIDEEELKAEKVKDEATRNKLLQMLKEIGEDDNPVLFIGTLK